MSRPDPAIAAGSARLRLDEAALVDNWRALARLSGAAETGAAVKADGYGLGAREVVKRLAAAGCENFFVATWDEAAQISDLVPTSRISVFNGLLESELERAFSIGARPVLNSPAQVERWRQGGGGMCDVMLDSGINRLGLSPERLSETELGGIDIDICMSHLASADEDRAQNAEQLARFNTMRQRVAARRFSLANSAGIALSEGYHFDLTRPGLAIYGGVPRPELAGVIRQVAFPEARVLQRRTVNAGDRMGYNATFTASHDMEVATVAIGYADGYARGFSNRGHCLYEGRSLPVIGLVSMDLSIIDVGAAPEIEEGDWVEIGYSLAEAQEQSGVSQYELLTGLGHRFARDWRSG